MHSFLLLLSLLLGHFTFADWAISLHRFLSAFIDAIIYYCFSSLRYFFSFIIIFTDFRSTLAYRQRHFSHFPSPLALYHSPLIRRRFHFAIFHGFHFIADAASLLIFHFRHYQPFIFISPRFSTFFRQSFAAAISYFRIAAAYSVLHYARRLYALLSLFFFLSPASSLFSFPTWYFSFEVSAFDAFWLHFFISFISEDISVSFLYYSR